MAGRRAPVSPGRRAALIVERERLLARLIELDRQLVAASHRETAVFTPPETRKQP